MLNFQQPEISFALRVALEASHLIDAIQSQTVTQILTKDDRSPVTIADFASQALVAALLMERFPQDVLVAEEDAEVLREESGKDILAQITKFVRTKIPSATSQQVCTWIDYGASEPTHRFWTLDPIDGTKGFLRGDQYVVALALLENNQVKIGVLGCPKLKLAALGEQVGCIVIGVRGAGTWAAPLHNPAAFIQLHTSPIADATQARLLRSFESGHTNVGEIETLMQRLNIQVPALRMDSQAKYPLLAGGEGELLLRMLSPQQRDYREKIWDQAAGSIILEEAGGKITDIDGKALDFSCGRTLNNNRGVFASNRLLHDEVLVALRELTPHKRGIER